MNYTYRIPTCANIAFGDIESWLSDWHSIDMLMMFAFSVGIEWIDESYLQTKQSDLAQRLRGSGFKYDGFDWSVKEVTNDIPM